MRRLVRRARPIRSDCDTDWIWIDPGYGHAPELTVDEGQPFRIGFLHFPDQPEEEGEDDRFAVVAIADYDQ